MILWSGLRPGQRLVNAACPKELLGTDLCVRTKNNDFRGDGLWPGQRPVNATCPKELFLVFTSGPCENIKTWLLGNFTR